MVRTQLRDGDRLHVIHVSDSKFKKFVKRTNSSKRELTDALGNFVKENMNQIHGNSNVHVILHVLHGNAKTLLISKIDEIFPDLVVAGSRANSRFNGFLMGSVSTYLVQKSLAPVVIARDPLCSRRFQRLQNNKNDLKINSQQQQTLFEDDWDETDLTKQRSACELSEYDRFAMQL